MLGGVVGAVSNDGRPLPDPAIRDTELLFGGQRIPATRFI